MGEKVPGAKSRVFLILAAGRTRRSGDAKCWSLWPPAIRTLGLSHFDMLQTVRPQKELN
jgi:hypothetical protein